MFDFTKKLFRVGKNWKDIKSKIIDIQTSLELWRKLPESTTLERTITIMAAKSMDVLVMAYFPYTNKHNYNEVQILLTFWYLYYYLSVCEENDLLNGQTKEEVFKNLCASQVTDSFEYQPYTKVNFTESKQYYIEKMEIYFRYHNFHTNGSSIIATEMTENVVNMLNSDDDDYGRKFIDVKTYIDIILPDFKEKILQK